MSELGELDWRFSKKKKKKKRERQGLSQISSLGNSVEGRNIKSLHIFLRRIISFWVEVGKKIEE